MGVGGGAVLLGFLCFVFVFNLTDIGTVSMATFRGMLWERAERVLTLSNAAVPSMKGNLKLETVAKEA